MKECPYCTSEILEKAKKCKHCGEWVEKKSGISIFSNITGTFNKGKDFLEKRKIEKEKERKKHLYIPSDEKPIFIKKISYYGDHLKYKEKKYYYSQIASINFKESASTIQGYSTYEVKFSVLFDNGTSKFPLRDKVNKLISVDLSSDYSSHSVSSAKRKQFEQTRLMYNVLVKFSYQNRYLRYLNSIEKVGYFPYQQYNVYPNGDLKLSGSKEIIGNIKNAKKEGLLNYKNTRFSDLRGGRSYDPYCLEIVKGKGPKMKFININLYNNISINVSTDKNIFDIILSL